MEQIPEEILKETLFEVETFFKEFEDIHKNVEWLENVKYKPKDPKKIADDAENLKKWKAKEAEFDAKVEDVHRTYEAYYGEFKRRHPELTEEKGKQVIRQPPQDDIEESEYGITATAATSSSSSSSTSYLSRAKSALSSVLGFSAAPPEEAPAGVAESPSFAPIVDPPRDDAIQSEISDISEQGMLTINERNIFEQLEAEAAKILRSVETQANVNVDEMKMLLQLARRNPSLRDKILTALINLYSKGKVTPEDFSKIQSEFQIPDQQFVYKTAEQPPTINTQAFKQIDVNRLIPNFSPIYVRN